MKLYADDLKLYATVDSQLDQENLQCKLLLLENWAGKWQLNFSVSKCKLLCIGHSLSDWHHYLIGGNRLDRVPERTDLGVIIDDRLCFHSHIRSVVARAHQRSNMILRCFLTRNVNCLIKAFTVYVRPIIEYCSPIWSPLTKMT